MLRSLSIRNYVLIDSLDILFPEGLVIITGQTGAGKSILLGALSLLTGVKADAAAVGAEADNCIVEAEFSGADESLRDIVEGAEADWNGGDLIIRRMVGRNGRSRSFVNDSPVNVSVLSSLAPGLVDIHSQHQTSLLNDRRFQLSILDRYAGNSGLLERCSTLHSRHLSLNRELAKVRQELETLERDREYNQSRFSVLEAAGLSAGELEGLEAEQKALANAESIKENLSGVVSLFSGDDGSGRPSLDASLKEAARMLSRTGKFIPEAESLSQRIESSRLEMADILSSVEDLDEKTEVSGERLAKVEERMSFIYDLFRKFDATTVEELLEKKEALGGKLFDVSSLTERKEELEKEIASAQKDLEATASALHESRLKASVPFAKAIEASLHGLELEKAIFSVSLSSTMPEISETGADSIAMVFSSTGKDAVDVAKCASGGEKSRIMLSLKAMMARYTDMPTMIFDEIDTGVSGSAADKMGSMICDMGSDMQVFAITHLPQVAAKGSAHYLVERNGSVSTIRRLEGEERVMEIARMLSGARITPAAIANARELLSL